MEDARSRYGTMRITKPMGLMNARNSECGNGVLRYHREDMNDDSLEAIRQCRVPPIS